MTGAASGPSLTPNQELARTARGANLLVSAAAGAGKTSVLVERIVALVTGEKPVDIDHLLVVTFTEAAATEMRERIAAALRRRVEEAGETDPEAAGRLRLQLALLGRASISTIHSFCLSVARRYFHLLDLDPAFEVLAQEEATLLEIEALDAVFETLYDQADPDFLGLVEAYGGDRGDWALRDAVSRLHTFSRSHPDPEAWLQSAVASFDLPAGTRLADLDYGRQVISDIRSSLEAAEDDLRLAATLAAQPGGPGAYLPVLERDVGRLGEAARALSEEAFSGDWAEVTGLIRTADTWDRLPAVKAAEADAARKAAVQGLRNEAKSRVGRLVDIYAARGEEELLAELRSLSRPMRALEGLVRQLDQAYRKAKDARARLDFADLEHYCLKALRHKTVAEEIRARYDEVLVDEYQDVSRVQEAILEQASRGDNLFMVGDMKQSIYRFRLAELDLFGRKRASFAPLSPGGERPPASKGWLVNLPDNFRSRGPIIAGVNFMFRRLMRGGWTEVGYGSEAELRCGRRLYDPAGEDGPEIEVHLVGGEDGPGGASVAFGEPEEDGDDPDAAASEPEGPSVEDLETAEKEACIIARRIRELVEPSAVGLKAAPLEVWDGQAGGYRPARFGDVVVLLRAATGVANQILDVFARAGVPAHAQLATGYFGALEVETVLSVLRLIDNPRQDIPLAAVLRSPLVGLGDRELAELRLSDRKAAFHEVVLAADGSSIPAIPAVRSFLRQLDGWRTAARRGPLSGLVWRIIQETGYYAHVGALPNGPQREANLRALYDQARRFDQFSRQGLGRFLRFIDRLRESEGDLGPPPALGGNENVVRIMSIHRSKGLEFPIVFLAGLGRRFNLTDTRADLLCHRNLGFGPDYVDLARRLKYPSLAKRAVASRCLEEALAEEMRVLYVGMTRAKDKLILVGSDKNLRETRLLDWCLGRSPSPTRLLRARSYLDWLGPALASHEASAALWKEASVAPPAPGTPDPSTWAIRLWTPGDVAAASPWLAAGPEAWSAAGAGEPKRSAAPDRPVPARLERVQGAPWDLAGRYRWTYPYAWAATCPAKASVSDLEKERSLDEEAAPLPPGAPAAGSAARPLPRPGFLEAAPRASSPTLRGRATHLLLRHADLGAALDEPALAELLAELESREVISPEEAAAADVRAVARFFASDLGRWLVEKREYLGREVPFTFGLDAREAFPDLAGLAPANSPGPPGAASRRAGETVLLQGIIDALVVEPDGLTLLDFKTDRVSASEVPARAEAYRVQVSLYSRAVAAIWNRPVKAVWLYFLAPGLAADMS